MNRDVPALEGLLTEDAVALSDGGGEFAAARNPIIGRNRVVRLYLGLAARRGLAAVEERILNGLPAIMVTFSDRPEHQTPRLVMRCEISADEAHRRAAPRSSHRVS